ncbi:4-hydroxythreonine-4-phosphate dehydrogenase PdxA [bacterium]|nr:4-hydroxythreonine-4-phosphate dehydrogenase PdxA [bacterium]
MKKIAITTGDIYGIGKEITLKALKELKLPKNQVVIIGEKLNIDYDFIEIDNSSNGEFCFQSLKKACNLALENKIHALVTAPVSKEELHKAGHIFNGQTEVIESFLSPNEKRAQMVFIADNLKLMLLTRHIPLLDIKLNKNEIINQILILNDFLKEKYKINSPKIALLALNPHSGENGVLGCEEIDILNPVSEILNEKGINITKALSADGFFSKIGHEYLTKSKLSYDCIVSCYHDQGLCPFKALAFNKAVNTTIGLKIIRTSPSSGTAYDIAGKNLANPESMVEAIKLAIKLS